MPKLTVAAIKKYTADTKRRREIPDAGAPALRLVIQPRPSGSKSWAMRFRRPDGRSAKLTLGPVDLSDESSDEPQLGAPLTLRMARQLAAKIDRERVRGIDVIAEYQATKSRARVVGAEQTANSFGAVVTEFVRDYKTRHGTRPRRWRHDAHVLGLDWPRGVDPATTEPTFIPGSVVDIWANKPVASIDSHDVHAIVEEARKYGVPAVLPSNRTGRRRKSGSSDGRGRHLHAALSVLFRWLLRHRRVTSNPTTSVWRPSPGPARERVLTNAEIIKVWQTADRVNPTYAAAIRLLLLTGARRAEVGGMRRSELSADGTEWTIPSERAKNHRQHLVPLPPIARQIISDLPQIACDFVLTTNGRASINGWSQDKKRIDALLGPSVPHWTLHDLRRTAATGMAEIGIAPHIIEAVLNHVSGHKGGVAGIYNRARYAEEKKVALARWAAHIEGLVRGKDAKVLALREAAS